MAGVMTALETHHDVGANRQPIDDLALSFIAPLGADNDDIGQSRLLFRLLKTSEAPAQRRKAEPGPLRPSPKRSASLSKGLASLSPCARKPRRPSEIPKQKP